MISYLLAGPESEPVSLLEAKRFLRIDDENEAEDGLIGALIAASRIHVEGVTGRALIAQGWRAVLDAWPGDRQVRLPVGPLMTLTAVTTYDEDGEAGPHHSAHRPAAHRTAPDRSVPAGER